MIILKEFQRVCDEDASAKGWNDTNLPVPEMIALIHSEASEALECYRNREPLSSIDVLGKPVGLASEFADILIRVGHYASRLGIDLEYEVERKLAYNRTRPHRHGDKVC